MPPTPEFTREIRSPTRKDAAIFRAKAALLQLRRFAKDVTDRSAVRFQKANAPGEKPVIALSKTPLWTETEPEERFLLAGKIHNLRLAIRRLDGIEVPAGQIFSFWKQIGRASRFRGFVQGRELREGCIIPSVGGGLCQLSNALYDAALQAGFEIVERHPHTRVVPGSLAEKGRDATVFWNYVDLRFRAAASFRVEAELDAENLIIRFRGETVHEKAVHGIRRSVIHSGGPNSCATCEMGDCHRAVDASEHVEFERTAFLLDEFVPEFDAYIRSNRSKKDVLMVPLDGRRFRRGNYAWTTNGFGSVRQSLMVTAKRSYLSRKLAAQGAARQINLLRMYEELAESYARRLSYDVLHLVVQQNLLPFLWRNGHLGGRTFDVLMTALPMSELQNSLDLAYSLHRESTTLGDFRADPALVEAEAQALRNARKVITTHTTIASIFAHRAEILEWQLPEVPPRAGGRNTKPHIVFPAATVGRKGCYELRQAVRGLEVRIILVGPIIESPGFWDGFDTQRGGDDWPSFADVIVLPAFVEHRPRRLLFAAVAGIPVIASTACGVAGVPGIKIVETGDIEALRQSILSCLTCDVPVV